MVTARRKGLHQDASVAVCERDATVSSLARISLVDALGCASTRRRGRARVRKSEVLIRGRTKTPNRGARRGCQTHFPVEGGARLRYIAKWTNACSKHIKMESMPQSTFTDETETFKVGHSKAAESLNVEFSRQERWTMC